MTEPEPEFDDLPRTLRERLARERNLAILTPDVDGALKRAAAEQFAARRLRTRLVVASRRARRAAQPHWRFTAVAAAVLVVLIMVRPESEVERNLAPVPMQASADDVDGSGRVDILDAFALARRRAADPAGIAQADVDALAARVVALSPNRSVL